MFSRFVRVTREGLIPICGFVGSSKTHMMSLMAFLFLVCPSINSIYCAAPSHVAVSNFAARLFNLGVDIAAKLDWNIPLVVRAVEIVPDLMGRVIMKVHAVCTTPHLVGEEDLFYSEFNNSAARGVIFDETGRMHKADAFQVLSPG
ncbi:hypothetical protein N0V88_007055 [Collariella sp. IMI 366227]|nr:hypothetical protein N0V88_007055 [Collariella sp. IMI 366227]